MLQIQIEDQRVLGALQKAVQAMNGRQRTEMMKRVAGSMLAAVERNFEQEGRPKWDDLKPSTIADRQRSGHWPGKILQRTGGLKRSITQKWNANEAVVGSNLIYAAIHNQGGEIQKKARTRTVRLRTDAKGRLLRQPNHANLAVFARTRHKRAVERQASIGAHSINIPQREFLKLTEQDLDDLTQEINDWYRDILQGKP